MTFERGSPHFLHFPVAKSVPCRMIWFTTPHPCSAMHPLCLSSPVSLYLFRSGSALSIGSAHTHMIHISSYRMCACIDSLVRCNKPTHVLRFCINYCGSITSFDNSMCVRAPCACARVSGGSLSPRASRVSCGIYLSVIQCKNKTRVI